VLLPEGLRSLKLVAKTVGLTLTGTYRNLDSGFDSKHNRKCILGFFAQSDEKVYFRLGRS
jgi:hypothetical protein